MKLTIAKCPRCDYRARFTPAQRDPSCPGCRVPMERTSRLSVGFWTIDGRVVPRALNLDAALRTIA